MPTLSQQTLEKRFKCPHCEKSFRGRQGLSGHIQFKHKSGIVGKNKSFPDQLIEFRNKSLNFKTIALESGLKQEDISKILSIFLSWERVLALFYIEKIRVDDEDLKNYLLMSMALMHANQQLFQSLSQDLSEAMAVGFTRVMSELFSLKNQSK